MSDLTPMCPKCDGPEWFPGAACFHCGWEGSAAEAYSALRARLERAEADAEEVRESLDRSCSAIDRFGFRSDDYGGPHLSECIEKLGRERDEARADTDRRVREARREALLAIHADVKLVAEAVSTAGPQYAVRAARRLLAALRSLAAAPAEETSDG